MDGSLHVKREEVSTNPSKEENVFNLEILNMHA